MAYLARKLFGAGPRPKKTQSFVPLSDLKTPPLAAGSRDNPRRCPPVPLPRGCWRASSWPPGSHARTRNRCALAPSSPTSRRPAPTRTSNGSSARLRPVRWSRRESFGQSEEGRLLPLLVISDPPVGTPAEARKLGRPLVFVQANIHAGEVEGKEAVLMLARRLVDGDLKPLTRQLVILIAPIYNADGNERRLGHNRPEQNGPFGAVGTRENATRARSQSRLHEARKRRGAGARRAARRPGIRTWWSTCTRPTARITAIT